MAKKKKLELENNLETSVSEGSESSSSTFKTSEKSEEKILKGSVRALRKINQFKKK